MTKSPLDKLAFYYYYGSGRYTLKTYYYSYDWNSFFADVGGFLGLLLGHSLLSFYDVGKHITQKFDRCNCLT